MHTDHPNTRSLRVVVAALAIWLVAATTFASPASAQQRNAERTGFAALTSQFVQLHVGTIAIDPGPARVTEARSNGSIGSLVGNGSVSKSGGCDVDFDDENALLVQTDHAANQFLLDPWRQQCGSAWTEITASVYDHLHLGFADTDIGPCFNQNEALAGSYARIIGNDPFTASCEPFDALTEPRTSPVSHYGDAVIRVRLYDEDGYTPFRLDRIRIKNTAVRLCAQPADVDGPYVAQGPIMPGSLAGASCWNLEPGLWDLSNHTDNTGVITLTGADGEQTPFSFDDLEMIDQS